jgi:ribosomal protein S18 acetylase RimI-like enzyme
LIRSATEADFDGLLALFDEVAAELIFIGTEPGYDRELYRRGWAASLADPNCLLLVADDGGTVAGMLGVGAHGGAGPHVGMLVSRTHRRRGLGRALLEAAVAWGRERGVPSLSLFVFPHNEGARALYRAMGFAEIERFERDVTRQSGEVWDTILMRKEL